MRGLSRFYPPDREVLKGINLSFYPGAKIGVIGSNGSGKSSLLRIMAGEDDGFSGEARLTPGFTVGYLAQEPQLDESKDVAGNVADGVGEAKRLVDRYNEVCASFGDPDAQVRGAAVPEQLADALQARERRAGPDDQGDADPGQVLGPLQAVGVALGRPAPGQPEAEEHHRAGGHVGQVVDRVAEQPHRAGQDRDQQLGEAGDGQADSADPDGPVGLAPFVGVVAVERQRERGGGVTLS